MSDQSGINKIRIIIGIVAISLINGSQHCVSPVLDDIQHHFSDVNVSLIQMLITIPCMCAIVMALITGWLALRIPQRTLFLFAALVSGVSGFLPYLADSFALLFFSRAFYGIGLGIAVSLVTALVATYFDGEERVKVMGIQAASVGVSVTLVSVCAGALGVMGFQYAYLINVVGFIALILIAVCLPKEDIKEESKDKKIRLNGRVFIEAAFIFTESYFVIVFTTNVAMYIAQNMGGSSSLAGICTGVFAAVQCVFGLVLGRIVQVARNYTLPVSMLAMALGYLLLVLLPGRGLVLIISAVLVGFSQGVYFPKAMVEVTNVVSLDSAPMASSVMTCALCFGQLIEPATMGVISRGILGSNSAISEYLIACIGITICAIAAVIWKTKDKSY